MRRWAPSVLVLVTTVLFVAHPADGSPGPPSTISGPPATGDPTAERAEAEVAAIEAQIAGQQQTVVRFSEQFDQSTTRLAQVQAKLARIRTRVILDRGRYRTAHRQLQEDAVNAYVYDAPATSISSLFSSASDGSALHHEYQDAAIGNVDAAVDRVRSDEHQLATTEQGLQTEVKQAESATANVHHSELAAQTATAAAEATLAQVKGRLAQMIAQQAAVQAARQAAAAAAAADAAARRHAVEQAAQDAQVAQTVGAGSPAATAAIYSANQAAGVGGGAEVVGNGGPEDAQGAGSVALTAAERYLGVPYKYGGASPSGLDCSGLTMLAWHAAGVSLVHSAELQRGQSLPIALSQVQPGDLLFYDLGGDGIDHVVIYVGSGPYGANTIIQAAHTGTVVEFDPIWYFGLVGAGRP